MIIIIKRQTMHRNEVRLGCIIGNKTRKEILLPLSHFHRSPSLQLGRRRAKLDNSGVGSPATLANSLQPISSPSSLQLIEEGGHELGTGGSEGVAKSHGPTVDVELVEVSANFLKKKKRERKRLGEGKGKGKGKKDRREKNLLPGQRNRGKGFVHLIKIHLIDGEARFLQNLLGGGDGDMEHHNGVISGKGHGNNLGTRLQAELLQSFLVTHKNSRG